MHHSLPGKIRPLAARARDWFFSWRAFPAWLFLLYLILFGVWIPFIGFYWDDWPAVFLARNFGPGGIFRYFVDERPLSAWTYILASPLLGGSRIGWQVLSLCLRFGAVLAVWWFLRALWPKRSAETSLAALIFAVYPVFSQQAQAITYHQLWAQFIFFFLSMGWTVLSIRRPEHALRYTILALLSLLANLSISEYFFGVELARPIVIWLALQESSWETRLEQRLSSRIKQAAWLWLPYLVVFGLFIAGWLVYLQTHSFISQQVGERIGARNRPMLLGDLIKDPIQTAIQLIQMALQDMVFVLFSSWSGTLTPQLIELNRPALVGYWLLAVLTAVACGAILLRAGARQSEAGSPPSGWTISALALGLAILLLGEAPAWITRRQAIQGIFDNRFAAVSMVGAGLLIAAAASWAFSRWKPLVVFVAVLVGLAAGFHLRTVDEYRQSWKAQTRLYWQLKWRAPSIKPDTLIITHGAVFDFMVRSSLAFAYNLVFDQPGRDTERLSYWTIGIEGREMERLPFSQGEDRFLWAYRQFPYQSRKADSLLIYFHPPDTKCYWFLSPEDSDLPDLPPQVIELLPVSNLSRIDTGAYPQTPPPETFGSSPGNGWCYYYQKASLARQQTDWAAAARFYREARESGFRPGRGESDVPFEWLPFIEGLARSGQLDEALQVTRQVFQKDPRYRQPICRVWKSIAAADTSPVMQQSAASARALLSCR